MSEGVSVDELDRGLVAALQLNGRAPWRQVARALEASEATVARRGQQLLDSGVVTVTGLLDHPRCGLGVPLQVRLRCRPGAADAVAEALAALPSAGFVALVMGGADVAAELVVAGHQDVARVLGSALSRPGDVVEIEPMMVVRSFAAADEWDPGLLGPGAAALLRRHAVPAGYREWREPERLTAQELAVARVLAADGRASYAQIADAVGTSESTAARRVDSLVRRGCLRFRTVFEAALIGFGVEFVQWLAVAPGELPHVAARLAEERSTRYASATTGRLNLCLHGVLPGYGDLYPYLTDVVGALPGVGATDITLLSRTFKRAHVRIRPDGTREPTT